MASFRSAFIAEGGPGYGEPTAGDHLQSVYRFWLLGHQLAHGDAPWIDPYSFQPLTPPQLNLSAWPWGVPFWPLAAAFGPVVAWNVLLLSTIVLAGIATYGWLRLQHLPSGAAALGGLAFALAPYRLVQSSGHLLGWSAALVPVALWAFERARCARTRRAACGAGLLSALALVSIPASGQVHLALGAIPFALLYAAVRFRPLAAAWLAAGCAAAVGLGFAIRHAAIDASNVATGRELDQVELFQTSLARFLHRSVPRDPIESERYVYLGLLTPLVAAAGFAALARRARLLAALLLAAIAVPALFALGTHTPIYPPLWRHLAPLHYTRVPERLLPLADLALAALAACGAALLLERVGGRRGAAAAAIACALIAADLLVFPFRSSAADPGNAAYRALRAEPGRIVELPLFEPGIHYGSIYLYYTLETPRERPGGYSTLAPYRAYRFFWDENRINCGVLRPGDLAYLRSLGVRALLFHTGAYAQAGRESIWFAWRALERAGLRSTAHGGSVWLFPLRPGTGPPQPPPVPEPDRGEPVLCEGWRGFQMRERDAPIWLFTREDVTLDLTAPGTTTAAVRVDGGPPVPFTVDRRYRLHLRLSGLRWHSIVLEVPQLFLDVTPPQGLTLERLSVGGG